MEIHHIDGDHDNNDINNLKLVTIQEHLNIHLAQKDWGACFAMSQRMGLSPEEISYFARQNALNRSQKGELPMQKAAKAGTHHWQVVNNGCASQMAKNGTHPAQVASKNGTHHWFGKNNVRKDHNQRLLASGSHPSQIKVSCLCCLRTTSINSFVRNHVKTPCK